MTQSKDITRNKMEPLYVLLPYSTASMLKDLMFMRHSRSKRELLTQIIEESHSREIHKVNIGGMTHEI